MKNQLPTKTEWTDAGFDVPPELCSDEVMADAAAFDASRADRPPKTIWHGELDGNPVTASPQAAAVAPLRPKMEDEGHTPEPWKLGCRAADFGEHNPPGWCITANGKRIANIPSVPHGEISESEQACNAELIVRAPSLLRQRDALRDACQAADHYHRNAFPEDLPTMVCKLRAALALCETESKP